MNTLGTVANFAGPLDARDRETIVALRRVLDAHGFATAAVPAAMGGTLRSDFHLRVDLPLYLRRLAGPAPINTLIKLFVLDQWVEESAARRALAPLDLGDVRALGLIEKDEERGVRARVRLSGYRDLVLAHDRYDEQLRVLQPDHVLDVNPTSVTLANLTVRRHVRSALDVGTGCGVLALLAARHADRVVATDTNARALNLASFNGQLNGIEHIEWRMGSLFEPVVGCRFDLIVCNPPCVISPDSQYVFRDSGRKGDAICGEIVRRLPDHLEEGGFASMLCNWTMARDEEWPSPLRRWVEGTGCDAWLLCSTTHDPLTYAAFWNRTQERERYEQALDRWVAYCRELNVDAIGLGAVILRRKAGGPVWVRTSSLPESPIDTCDSQIQRVFRAEDYLASIRTDAALLAHTFVVADDHRVIQTLAPTDDAYESVNAEIELTGGFRTRGSVDAYTVRLLARCDGRRSLNEIVSELAWGGGPPRDQIATASAAIVKRLVAAGFLIPADERS
jgi:methylase of polypeptide subunit release factors